MTKQKTAAQLDKRAKKWSKRWDAVLVDVLHGYEYRIPLNKSGLDMKPTVTSHIQLLYRNPGAKRWEGMAPWVRDAPKHPDYRGEGYEALAPAEPAEPPRPDLPDWVQVGAEFDHGGALVWRITALRHPEYADHVECECISEPAKGLMCHTLYSSFRNGIARQRIPWTPTPGCKVRGKAGTPGAEHDFGNVRIVSKEHCLMDWYANGAHVGQFYVPAADLEPFND
jgi:hypothetical protein